MELRQLEYFQTVCQQNSITKAADHLHIAQPSVSIAIKKLEEELGISLFNRSKKQIILTPEGQVFLQRVNDIINRVNDSVTEMNDYKLLQKGSIKLGVPPMIGSFLFPHIFAEFRKIYPQFELFAVEGGSLYVKKQLEKGLIDIGIITLSDKSTKLETLPITSGQIHVCLPYDHSLSSLSSIPFNDLRNQRLILLKKDTYSRQMLMDECKKNNFTPKIVFSSSQIETIVGLVEQGVGISFLLETIVKKHSEIISRPLADPLYIHIVLAWNKTRYLSNASKIFIDFITSLYR